MSEVTLSRGELDFLKQTFELVLEEFSGIEEYTDSLNDYVLTTGALEQTKEACVLIDAWYTRLQKEDLEELEDVS